MKKTIAARLQEQREHKPNPVLYAILRLVVAIIGAPLKIKFIYKARPAEDKGPIVLVANHASRIDYVYTAPAVGSKRLNYVVGYNEFFVFPTNILLKVAQVIPKRNFTPDLHAVQSMMRIIREGGNICFMPEGMNSITGMAQPVMWGTGKLLRKLGVNVYYTMIKSGYLSNTKHCQKQRPGRTEVVVDRMFTADELKQLSDVQIEDRMNRLLAHDDYMWNAVEKIKFDAKGWPAEKLETLLYMCPKCGAMHKMVSDATTLTCTECGNKVEIDEYGAIRPAGPDSVCPPLVTDWTLLERKRAASDVREPGFSYSGHVRIGLLPDYKYLT
ncbi:MAG: 1-acyl-sn-glycerol-3-phosphate acyltransferase, partial [Bacteroidales bacterium]|nr:1-acyl-sn-glycerol-3-phosphate acyltransferase [Bacteroidales bacterium]